MAVERLDRAFFACPADRLAPRLVGHRLVRVLANGQRLSGVIVEVEAYLGAKDRACHTFAGRRTPRCEAMYGPPGTAYVYFTYGMHWCLNVVCGERPEGVAVLLRALEPIDGLEAMARHRGDRPWKDRELCSGPAKLCQALAIDRSLNGVDLVEGVALFLERAGEFAPRRLVRTTRIGVASAGEEWAGKPLRWYVRENPHVSVPAREKPRRAARPKKTRRRA